MKSYVFQINTGETLVSEHNTREEALEETARTVGNLVEFAVLHNLRINVCPMEDGEVYAVMSDSSEWHFWVE